MKKVKYGFIGAGSIAKKALYPALKNSNFGEIEAVAGKDPNRAKALSPNGKIYTDYQDLIDDPEIEAVYISLPNSLHIPWSIKAMQAGKHVLCEKPVAMNAKELEEAIKIKNETGMLFMEASWNRWHPRTIRIKELVDKKVIGEIKEINAGFTYDGLDPSNIRAIPELGGGSLYDLGPYSTVAPLWILDFAPVTDIKTEVTWHPGGSDETTIATFKIGNAIAKTLTSMNIPDKIYLGIIGEKGKIATLGNDAFNSHNKPSQLEITIDGKTEIENFAACDPYQLMADSFSKAIRGEKAWLLPLADSLRFAKHFDAIFATMKK
ncbi:MAG: Gfo/Idh/MocA family protein [Actinomycetes bacterium]